MRFIVSSVRYRQTLPMKFKAPRVSTFLLLLRILTKRLAEKTRLNLIKAYSVANMQLKVAIKIIQTQAPTPKSKARQALTHQKNQIFKKIYIVIKING